MFLDWLDWNLKSMCLWKSVLPMARIIVRIASTYCMNSTQKPYSRWETVRVTSTISDTSEPEYLAVRKFRIIMSSSRNLLLDKRVCARLCATAALPASYPNFTWFSKSVACLLRIQRNSSADIKWIAVVCDNYSSVLTAVALIVLYNSNSNSKTTPGSLPSTTHKSSPAEDSFFMRHTI